MRCFCGAIIEGNSDCCATCTKEIQLTIQGYLQMDLDKLSNSKEFFPKAHGSSSVSSSTAEVFILEEPEELKVNDEQRDEKSASKIEFTM